MMKGQTFSIHLACAKTLPLLVGLVIVGASIAFPGHLHAEDAQASQSALAVSPAIVEEVLDPGKPVEFTVRVNNITNFPLPIKGTAQSFTVQSEELEKTERSRLDVSQWIHIDEPDFILQPKQTRTVKGSIIPPKDAPPGGHYATIFFQPLVPSEALTPSTAYLNAKVGVLTFLVVKGEMTQGAGFKSGLKTDSWISRGPAKFTFSIHNSGNVHLMPQGRLVIYDWRGARVTTLELPSKIILPNATKEYLLEWSAPHALGKYRAELEVSYGDQQEKLAKSTVMFWVMPWFEIIGGSLLLGLLAFFVIKTRHRWSKTWRVLRGKDIRFH